MLRRWITAKELDKASPFYLPVLVHALSKTGLPIPGEFGFVPDKVSSRCGEEPVHVFNPPPGEALDQGHREGVDQLDTAVRPRPMAVVLCEHAAPVTVGIDGKQNRGTVAIESI